LHDLSKTRSAENIYINEARQLKVNHYLVRFFIYFFVEIQWTNTMVNEDEDQPEVSLLFVAATGWYLPRVARYQASFVKMLLTTGDGSSKSVKIVYYSWSFIGKCRNI
jgi:hypothetical protein